MPFKFYNLSIQDVILIETVKFKDDRGFFEEVFKVPDFLNSKINLNVKQIFPLQNYNKFRIQQSFYSDFSVKLQ